MKKILLRAAMSPLVNHNPTRVVMRNMIGNNIGNLLFQSSVTRTLLCDDTTIDTVNTVRKYSSDHIRRINENYECLVLPFANAFRVNFIYELEAVTNLVEQLKIPCIIVGVGAQAGLNKEVNSPELDEAVTKLMKAVLKKSNKVGLRGEFTADYLTKLGFQAERDFTVIGCPSMYMYGKKLPAMEVKELTKESDVSMNSKISLPQKFHDFMYRSSLELPNYNYVPQVIEEIGQMFMGKRYPAGFATSIPEHFPVNFAHPIYQSGKGITFTNMPSWLEYLRNKDFSFGSRIHGNIAAILAGTPCFIVVSDNRIMELVEFHHIPHLLMKDLNKSTNIFDLHEKADFSAIQIGHEKHFIHYLDFLKENGLETIYDKDGNEPEIVPFDKKISEVKFAQPVKAFSALTPEQQLRRLRRIYKEDRKKTRYYKKMSTGVMASIKDWKRREIEGNPSKNYESYYPFIREYKDALVAEQMRNAEDNAMSENDDAIEEEE
ncbi:MAG: polysaccharide pyruvyl transferase family protein [Lachnospiraceae bacterium]|nr:polysaccharide pyruvyl transferase family protein [Lachnospiraceae bacterium]